MTDPRTAALAKLAADHAPHFAKTYCSQCGGEFGPGDHGFSHCQDHRSLMGVAPLEDERLAAFMEIASLLRSVDQKLVCINARLGLRTGVGA